MILILGYKTGEKITKFDCKAHITEHYYTTNYSEFRIFLKDYRLKLTEKEYEILSGLDDFEICLNNGVVLFTKAEVVLSPKEIWFKG